MSGDKNKKEQELMLNELPEELMKKIFEEQKEFTEDVFNYNLNETLDDVSQPLTLKEKRSLKKYNLQNVDAEDDFDGLILDLAKIRGLSDETIDNQRYSELAIWVRKVAYGTFDLKKAAKR